MFGEKPRGEGYRGSADVGGRAVCERQDGTGGVGTASQRRCCVPRSVPPRTRVPPSVVEAQ